MSKCWTCGSAISDFSYRCGSCSFAKRIDDFEESVIDSFESFSQAQVEELQYLQNTVEKGIYDIASIVEWGFGELEWQLQKQTSLLSGIDNSLKTPSQTQADEWRVMSDELRKRGVIDKSKEFAIKSLKVNPLDYRTYISLSKIELKQNALDEAENILFRSLPHAPKEKEFDYRSFSYRLIGHVRECKEDIPGALKYLVESICYSPEYSEGLYDFSRYVSLLENDIVHEVCNEFLTAWGHNWAIGARNKNYNMICDMALSKAIKAHPKFWYFAKLEPGFKNRLEGGGFSIFGKLDSAQRYLDWNIGSLKRELEEMNERLINLKKMIVIKTARTFSKSIEKHIKNMGVIIEESRRIANLDKFEKMYKSEDLITTLKGKLESDNAVEMLKNKRDEFYKEYEATPWGFF